jgi:hypothetical protein
MTLGEALPLANKAICVVVPCNVALMNRIANDPRICEFFKQARSNNARFILSHIDTLTQPNLRKLSIPMDNVSIYNDTGNLIEFAQVVTNSLVMLAYRDERQ